MDAIEIDIKLQKVTVNGIPDQKKVLKRVRKTGLRAELWQLPYTTDSQNQFVQQHHCNGPVNYYASQPSSSYNYYKHGYDSSDPRYYQYPSQSSSIFGQQTGSAFSDDNPHACSIMWSFHGCECKKVYTDSKQQLNSSKY